MNKISLAIPTYFSSRFIVELINTLTPHKVVDEIVISDDSENNTEFKKLEYSVKESLKLTDIKLNITKNNKNLGGFKNKYKCVENCSNQYIYQIDSDNLARNKTLKYISRLEIDKLNNNTLHIPASIYLFENNKYEMYLNPSKKVVYKRKSTLINFQIVKNNLIENKKFVVKKNIDWLLNTGNPFFNKLDYLESLKPGLKYETNKLSACSIAMVYFWLLSGKEINVSKYLAHYHRVRKDSYYVEQGSIADNSVSYFKQKFIN